jgi:tRNA(Ile2) C34 agmatinyltransferase TiaS
MKLTNKLCPDCACVIEIMMSGLKMKYKCEKCNLRITSNEKETKIEQLLVNSPTTTFDQSSK